MSPSRITMVDSSGAGPRPPPRRTTNSVDGDDDLLRPNLNLLDPAQRQLFDAIKAVDTKLDALTDAICGKRSACAFEANSLDGAAKKSLIAQRKTGNAEDFAPPVMSEDSEWMSNSMSQRKSTVSGQASERQGRRAFRDFRLARGGDLMQLQVRPGFAAKKDPISFSPAGSNPRFRRLTRRTSENESNPATPRRSLAAWNPDSKSRTVFEVTSMLMLVYDAFVVPYGLAWEISFDTQLFQVAIWVTRIFWTTDLLLNFMTGFRDADAKLVLDIYTSARRYVSTWFLPDLALVTCDWVTILDAVAGGQKYIPYMRLMRLLRSGRQILRGWTLVMKAKLVIQEKAFHLMMDIALLMMLILWVNHVVCCCWFGIGKYTTADTGLTWLTNPDFQEVRGGEYYDYLTALHWAITQMTPGSMEITPKSSGERAFNVVVLLLGLLMGSSLVATLTSMMTQYKLRVEGASRKLMILHQYLVQQHADPELAFAIKLQVKARSTETVRLKTSDVEYLSLLSQNLQDALWHGWCMQQLSGHPLLNSLHLVDASCMQALSKHAMKSLELPPGDAVFEEGAQGDHMFFLVHGGLIYLPGDLSPEAAMLESDAKLHLKPGAWCSEPALWAVWTHLGTLEATAIAEVCALSGTNMLAQLQKYPVAFGVVQDYCATFVNHMNEPGCQKTDLAYCFDIFELISSMSLDSRFELATPVLGSLESSVVLGSLEARFMNTFISKPKLELLKQEVRNGECDVGLVGKEVVRNTFVVALKVSQFDDPDRFLVGIGGVIRDTGRLDISILLPGVKRKWRESYINAVDRILETELTDVASQTETHFGDGSERTVSLHESPTYNIRTRYLRTTFWATLDASVKLCALEAPRELPRVNTPSTLSLLFRRESRHTATIQREIIGVLHHQRKVVVMKCDSHKKTSHKMYLWLNPREFDLLSHPAAKPILQEWLSPLGDIGECLMKNDPPSADSTIVDTAAMTSKSDSDSGEIDRISF